MNELLNAVIQLTEEGSTTVGKFGKIKKVKGRDIETGKVNTYTIYETKQDGSISDAWATYNNGALLGQTVQVGYVTKEGTLQDGTPFTQRIIRTFDLDIGNGVANTMSGSQTEKTLNLGHSIASEGHSSGPKDDVFWEKQAYEKCVSLWMSASIQHSGSEAWAINALDKGTFWEIFQAIKADGNKRFSPLRQAVQKHAPQVVEELPTIQIEDEVNVDGIPF